MKELCQDGNQYVWYVSYSLDDIMKSYSPLESFDQGFFNNSVWTGSWIYSSKMAKESNVFKKLIEDDATYFVFKEDGKNILQMYTQYLSEHYGYADEPRMVDVKYGYSIYKFS